jgi:hypothetical protein
MPLPAYFSHMPSNNSAPKISASNAIITIARVSTCPSKTKLPACQKKLKVRLIVSAADRMLTAGDIQGVWDGAARRQGGLPGA